MMMRMLKLLMHSRRQSARQKKLARRACRNAEPLLEFSGQGYAIPDTQQFTAQGPGGEHRIYVAVPPGEAPPNGFPILFVMDADAIFGTAVDAVRLQMPWPDTSEVTPFVIVGIGYPGSAPFNHRRRSWDLAPPLRNPTWRSPLGMPWHQPGGADDMIDFLTGPLLDALRIRYPINGERRGVCGLSLGGTFALYALAAREGAFSFHAAISSALWFDDRRVIDELAALKPGKRSGAAFIALGKQEIPNAPNVCSMMLETSVATVGELKRLGIPVTHLELEGENHQSTIVAVFPRLMREVSRLL